MIDKKGTTRPIGDLETLKSITWNPHLLSCWRLQYIISSHTFANLNPESCHC